MRPHLTLFLGIFTVMALSNAIVPVLPFYADSSSVQGMIFAVYFLGAFMVTLPAGILSDRFGRIPLIRLGLAITVISGLFLAVTGNTVLVLTARLSEGIGAGLFVAAAMSCVNTDPDHVRMSGYLMAFLNAGLVSGLLLAGWLAAALQMPASGIILFALLAVIPVVSGFFVREPVTAAVVSRASTVLFFIAHYRWLWYSSIVLIGITGVVTSLYPKFSGASSDILGFWIAGMSIATIAAVLIYSRMDLSPIQAIRWSAVLMGAGVLVSFVSAMGFLIIGALAGIIMISQMAFLAGIRKHQGVVMGLFSTASYLGMALLPAAAGFIADSAGFFNTFFLTGLCAVSVAILIGRCPCGFGNGEGSAGSGNGKEQ